MAELFVLVTKREGIPLRLFFWSRSDLEQHIDGLGAGKGTEDNEHIRNGLEVKRYVIAAMEAA